MFIGIMGLGMLKFQSSKNTIILMATCVLYAWQVYDSKHAVEECDILEAPVSDQIKYALKLRN
jgi:hypothetical protein